MRIVLLGAIVTAFALTVGTIAFLFFDPCANSAFEEFRSPAGRWKVVVFERDCGATTGFSTQASLLPLDAPLPKEAGNILSIDDDHGKIPTNSKGKIDVTVRFDDGSAVTLVYPAAARVFSQVASKDGLLVRHAHLRGAK
jgi:hypothetical protein